MADFSKTAKQAKHNQKRKLCRDSKRFTIDVSIPDTDDSSRLENVKKRWYVAKESLCVTRKSSTTQNADVLEALLQAYEDSICTKEAMLPEETGNTWR